MIKTYTRFVTILKLTVVVRLELVLALLRTLHPVPFDPRRSWRRQEEGRRGSEAGMRHN